MRERRRLGAGALAVLVAVTAGCMDFGDDTDDASSTTTRPPAATASSGTTLPPLTTWPAGVVWGELADGQIEFDLPVEEGAIPLRTVNGPAGRVAVGRTSGSSGALGPVNDLSEARIWYQEDEAWHPVESTGLPNGTSALYDVVAWTGGYVAVGFHAEGYERHATAVVLTSPDGRTWSLTAWLPTTWSGWGSRVRVTPAGAALVEVSAAVCFDGAQFVENPDAQITTPTLWTAAAPTETYTQLPATALAALTPAQPTPSDGAGCFADFLSVPENERPATFGTELGSIAAVGDRLVVLDPGATTVSVTSDLTTWTSTALPDAVSDPLGSLLFADANERIVVVTVTNRPLGEGYVAGTVDPDAWVSTAWMETDDGRLRKVAPWRPIYAKNLTFLSLEARDGLVRLLAFAPAASPGDPPVLRIAESAPTAPQSPPTCTPAPQADCNFVTLADPQLADTDLSGIQLYGAVVDGGALDRANLEGALLARSTFTGTTLTGTYFTSATLLGARFAQVDLSGAGFAYADATGASFVGSVLTGAGFGGATIDGATVDETSTCPNGSTPDGTVGAIIAAACQL